MARSSGSKSQTARASWSRTTDPAHLRAVSWRCRATFWCASAGSFFAVRYAFDPVFLARGQVSSYRDIRIEEL
ncbi:hypothetical protein H8R17_04655 [Streptomyces sp. TRM68367]|nr:hypothetical protein [Streptomyces sp. TRM68367]